MLYKKIFDAKNACDHLSGLYVCNRYLIVVYYQPNKMYHKINKDMKKENIDTLEAIYGVTEEKGIAFKRYS